VEAGHLTIVDAGEPQLAMTATSAAVLRNQRTAELWSHRPPRTERDRPAKKSKTATEDLSASDAALFERLRAWRRRAATDRSVPPFVIMSDAVLVEVCRSRPASVEELRWVKGIGAKKMADFGQELVDEIRSGVNS
jgi:ATP-dependent DNA helicase RecQ